MTTAIDTNVLIEVLRGEAVVGDQSKIALDEARTRGALSICEAVYSELAAGLPSFDELNGFLTSTGIAMEPCRTETLFLAGRAWRAYSSNRSPGQRCPGCGASQTVVCPDCGRVIRPRQHILTDFIIGAHALLQADRLLTRDKGYFQTYFPDLELMSPR